MKRVISLIVLFAFMQITLNAQTAVVPPELLTKLYKVKSFNIYPVADSEVEIKDVSGGTKDVVPYDFYAAFNCGVSHPIDTVFFAEGENLQMTIESSKPCYVIIIGIAPNGQPGDARLFEIGNKRSNGAYRDTIDFTNSSFDILSRIIVVNAEYVLKKTVASTSIAPGPGELFSMENPLSSMANLSSQSSSYCKIDVMDVDYHRNNHIEGNITGDNVYLLQGDVMPIVGISYQKPQLPHVPYTIFTKNSTTDVELFIINSDNEIIAHNNNYTVESDYDWGTESRVDLSGNDSLKAVVLIPYRSYLEQVDDFFDAYCFGEDYVFQDNNPAGATDLYLGCKYYDFTYDGGLLFFPNLKINDAIESDYYRHSGISFGYSCYAWALGYYSYYSHHNYGGEGTAEGLAYYYGKEGYTTEGATEGNSEIDIWENNGRCTHASIRSYTNGRSYGYAWESKDGLFGGRFMHPRYALTNDAPYLEEGSDDYPYGHVVLHMIKNPNYVESEIVYENIDFSDAELENISQFLSMQPASAEDAFEEKYALMETSIKKSHISNPALFKECVSAYKDLLKLCKTSTVAQCQVMQKLSKGDILAAYLLLDMKLSDESVEAKMGKVSVPDATINEETQRVVRPDLSEAVLYAKALLSEIDDNASPKMLTKDVSYSNEEKVVSIDVAGKRANINFQLGKESVVSLVVGRHDGSYSKILMDQQLLQSDAHHVIVDLSDSGLYAVTLIINGHIYMKKFSVR